MEETGETHCEDNRDVNLTPQNSVHDYIDEKFHETLIKEVTTCVKTELHESNLKPLKISILMSHNAFIMSLQNEVKFLKDKIRSLIADNRSVTIWLVLYTS